MAAFTRSSACKTLPHGGIPAFTRVVLEGQDETMETERMGQDEREREEENGTRWRWRAFLSLMTARIAVGRITVREQLENDKLGRSRSMLHALSCAYHFT